MCNVARKLKLGMSTHVDKKKWRGVVWDGLGVYLEGWRQSL